MLVGAVVALIVFFVATALVSFSSSTLIIGLICVSLWIIIAVNWKGFGSFSLRA